MEIEETILKYKMSSKDIHRSKGKRDLCDIVKMQKKDIKQPKQIEDGKEQLTGRFAEGNQFWKVRSKPGRPPKFRSADQLLHACEEYFQWVEEHPFYVYKILGHYRGKPVMAKTSKYRPMTIRGLCLFLGISQATWWSYKKRSTALLNVCCRVEQVIWVQKFEGVVLGFFKPSIIARELKLRKIKGY